MTKVFKIVIANEDGKQIGWSTTGDLDVLGNGLNVWRFDWWIESVTEIPPSEVNHFIANYPFFNLDIPLTRGLDGIVRKKLPEQSS